jgi:hypothetical protein
MVQQIVLRMECPRFSSLGVNFLVILFGKLYEMKLKNCEKRSEA